MNTHITTPTLKHVAFHPLALAIAPLLSFAAAGVLAQTNTQAPAPQQEHMLVIGQGASIDKAIQAQRRADSIKNVVSADAMAQLPDENVAEAIQRLPGVSIERDQGEGRFVSVRGLGPDFNSVNINGTLIPAPNSGTRAVALDVIPSELVESLSVVKAATPDMDANSLGGSIDVESMSAFDRNGRFYTVTAEASYDDNTDETSPKFSGAFSNRFSLGKGTDNLGIAVAFSWQERDFGSDNIETGGAWDYDDGAKLEELEQRDYSITRERTGLGINLDYKINDNNTLFLRTLYSEFTDTEIRQAAGVEFADAQASGESGDAEGWRELKDRKETQEIESYVLGGEFHIQQWTIHTQVGYGKSSEDTPGHIDGAVFEGDDDFANAGFTSSRKPVLTGAANFYDPALFVLDEVEWSEQNTTDTETSFKLDLTRDYQWSGRDAQIKFGGKYSTREKDNDTNVWAYEDFSDYGIADEDLLLSSHAGAEVDYSLNTFGPSIRSGSLSNLIRSLDADEFYDEEASRIEDFVMDEDITAAYLMNTVDINQLRIILGVRYEGTDFSAKGTGLRDDVFEPVNASHNYEHWLPGAHLRYKLGENTQWRAAWTNSVVRPTFEQVMPGFVIDGDEAEFGNPQLDALESSNIDLGIEHYLGRAGILSAFVFYKDIENFIYEADVAGAGAWVDFDEAQTFTNGDSAELYGIELAWSQQLTSLPSPWNRLLVGANLTFSQSDASIGDGADKRDIDLPYQSDKVGNFLLGWEDEKLSLRLSVNYKDSYLQEVAALDGKDYDLYVDEQTFVDFSARYYVTPQINLSFEAQNITDEAYYVYTGSEAYNAQYEEYGPTFKIGITFTSM